MPPKKKRGRSELGEGAERAAKLAADGTLSGVSNAAVAALLDRSTGRRGRKTAPARAAEGGAAAVTAAEREAEAAQRPQAAEAPPPDAQRTGADLLAMAQGGDSDDEIAAALAAEAAEARNGALGADSQDDDPHDWEDAAGLVAGTPSGDVEFELQRGGSRGEGTPGDRKKRAAITKADRQYAMLLHQANLLFLLGRGLLFDRAADDPLLQATMLSLAGDAPLPVDPCGSPGTPIEALQPLAAWFRGEFRATPPATEEAELPDDLSMELPRRGRSGNAAGLPPLLARLQEAVEKREGTAEELAALFVALLRAAGCLTRLVRALQPLPVRPGAAPDTPQSRGRPPRLPSHRDQPAQQRRRQHSSTTAAAAASPAATPAAAAAAAAGSAEAGPASEGGAGVVGGGAGEGGGRKGGRKQGGGGRGRKRKGQDDAAAAAAAAADDVPQLPRSESSMRRRRGDEEFEQQLAMAMMATGAASGDMDRGGEAVAGPSLPPPAAATHRQKGVAWGRKGGGSGAHAHGSGPGLCWAEVYCGPADTGRWVALDPLQGWVDQPQKVDDALSGSVPLAYVVAFANGGAKDVTQRYVPSLLAVERWRAGAWWDQTLQPLRSREVAARLPASGAAARCNGGGGLANGHASREGSGRQHVAELKVAPGGDGELARRMNKAAKTLSAQEMRAAREDAELGEKAVVDRSALPTTLEGFKKHPLYVLQRHIPRYSALAPNSKSVGLHRGEPYYLRDNLAELHTAEAWKMKEGREVAANQLASPVKEVRKRGYKPSGKDRPLDLEDDQFTPQPSNAFEEEEGSPADGVTRLYGEWQTVAWAPPAARDGQVPKNERGNVNVPPYAQALPAGTVHLRFPRMAPVCRGLGVDFAHAMAGFEIRGGRSVPLIDGVVVCAESEAAVMEAYHLAEREREERARAKAAAEADALWRQVLRAALTRVRLEAEHASGRLHTFGSAQAPGGEAAAAAAPAAKGGRTAAAAIEAAAADMDSARGGITAARPPHFGRRSSGGGGTSKADAVELSSGDEDRQRDLEQKGDEGQGAGQQPRPALAQHPDAEEI